MSRLYRSIPVLLFGLFSAVAVFAQAMMTDEQVLRFVQQGVRQGKSREEMVSELSLRGVTMEQVRRVYTSIQSLGLDEDETGLAIKDKDAPRTHVAKDDIWQKDDAPEGKAVDEKKFLLEDGEKEVEVYGRDIFRAKALDFAPSENIATPKNYRLGPGDEVIIDIFGHNQTTIRDFISPEGSINVEDLGPLYLSGMTVDEANKYLRKRLSQIYGGLGSGTDMRFSLGQIRSIQVNVLGDVAYPGSYTMSAFATAFHALYRAGGVVEPGTLREIKIVRGDRIAGKMDVYELLMKGSLKNDIRLEEGDVVLVSPYKSIVNVEGRVKRPMSFEMKEGETLRDLLEYCGGFSVGANTTSVTVYRQSYKVFEIRTVEDREFGSFILHNGDRVEVGGLKSLFENRIAVYGSVYFPGTYELGEDLKTVKQLVNKAGGLLPEAFTDRVVVYRENPDKSKEVFSLNLSDIMDGVRSDFTLRNNDELYISSSFDLKDQGTMTIDGMVKQPGTYPFAANTTVEDLIILAGGLQDGASVSRVDITRRKKDVTGLVAGGELGELFSFPLKDGLIEDGVKGFVLEPYDEVMVHRSPSYNVQRHFTVTGEVNFPGTYSLTSREERVSDLIKKAGGLTEYAYVKGARLVREATEEEITQAEELGELLVKQVKDLSKEEAEEDSLKTVVRNYSISLDLERILANPGGESDVVLRENDRLEIPVRSNVVRVFGAVMHPMAVNFDKKMSVADYIDAAGGYSTNARRLKTYIVYMGGRAKKVRPFTKVEPGAEIFVPERQKKGQKDYSGMVAISSAAASMGTLGVALVSMLNSINKNN